jgi:hypothetical protein
VVGANSRKKGRVALSDVGPLYPTEAIILA